MKLSKAQQAIVDKMREGWDLKRDRAGSYLIKEGKRIIRLFDITVDALERGNVIEPCPGPIPPYFIYRLTEQYKTANNENSNTGDTAE